MVRPLQVVLAFTAALWALPALARDTREPTLLEQRNADMTPLCIGCRSAAAEVYVGATSAPDACGPAGLVYTLEIEVRPSGSAFTGVATHTSEPMVKTPCTSQAYPPVLLTGLSPGLVYEWRAREVASSGSNSAWVSYATTPCAFLVVEDSGPATQLHLYGLPAEVERDRPATFTVGARDICGNVATRYLGTVRFALAGGSGALPGDYTFVAEDRGEHIFVDGLRMDQPGTVQLSAMDIAAPALQTLPQPIAVVEPPPGEPPSPIQQLVVGCGCQGATPGAFAAWALGAWALFGRRRRAGERLRRSLSSETT